VRWFFASFSLIFLLGGCKALNPYHAAARSHHTPEGFKNNCAAQITQSRADLMRWWYVAWQNGLPRPPEFPVPTQAADLKAIHAYSAARPVGITPAPSITWIGHATMRVQAGGLNVLTDPIFSERASPVPFLGPKRAQPPGVALKDLPPIDGVLISHNHHDHHGHLDRQSVLDLAARSQHKTQAPTLFLVPLGLKAGFTPIGIAHVIEMDWWDQHSNPAETVQVHKDLGAKRSVGVHWGTFNLTDESLDQPVRDLAQARLANGLREEDFFMMKIGETRPLPARTAHP